MKQLRVVHNSRDVFSEAKIQRWGTHLLTLTDWVRETTKEETGIWLL